MLIFENTVLHSLEKISLSFKINFFCQQSLFLYAEKMVNKNQVLVSGVVCEFNNFYSYWNYQKNRSDVFWDKRMLTIMGMCLFLLPLCTYLLAGDSEQR